LYIYNDLMKNKGFTYRFSIYILVSAILLSGIVILISYFYFRNLMLESNRYRLQFEVSDVLEAVENSMENAAGFTRYLAMDFKEDQLQKNPEKFLSMIFQEQPNTYQIGLITISYNRQSKQQTYINLYRSNGFIIKDTAKFESGNKQINEWLGQFVNNSTPEWSTPFYNTEINSRAVVYLYPFEFYVDGEFIRAALYCSVALDDHLKSLENPKMFKPGFTILLNEKNQVVYHPDSLMTGQNGSSADYRMGKGLHDIGGIIADRTSGLRILNPDYLFTSCSVVAIFWPIKYSNWFIVILVPENLFMSEIRRLTLVLVPLILFIGFVVATVLKFNSAKLISPISFLASNSNEILADTSFNSASVLNDSAVNTSDKNFNLEGISAKYPSSPLKDIEILSLNMEKIKDKLTVYRESSLQNDLDKAKMDKELKMALEIEIGMVPTNFPLIPGRTDFDCFGKLIPSKIVCGDLFDIFLIDDNQLFFSINDTLGKGIPAALYSTMTQIFIRSIANPITRLGKIMESLNNSLSLLHDSEMFATIIIGKLNLITGEFVYCNAGHPHPFILRNDLKNEFLTQSHGIPVGVKRNLHFGESRIVLAPGESIIAFSDGITEQQNDEGDFFGSERLINFVSPLWMCASRDIVSMTLEHLEKFRGRTEVHDDITMITLKYLGK
jgi:sigma-B regulation protein RsbU (phosphoserine phosphatase)